MFSKSVNHWDRREARLENTKRNFEGRSSPVVQTWAAELQTEFASEQVDLHRLASDTSFWLPNRGFQAMLPAGELIRGIAHRHRATPGSPGAVHTLALARVAQATFRSLHHLPALLTETDSANGL